MGFTGNVDGIVLNTFTTQYNLSPTDVSITANRITINKSGLYHFEGDITVQAAFSIGPTLIKAYIYFFKPGGIVYVGFAEPLYQEFNNNLSHIKTFHFSKDFHIPAGSTLDLGAELRITGGTATSKRAFGTFSGYLVSE